MQAFPLTPPVTCFVSKFPSPPPVPPSRVRTTQIVYKWEGFGERSFHNLCLVEFLRLKINSGTVNPPYSPASEETPSASADKESEGI